LHERKNLTLAPTASRRAFLFPGNNLCSANSSSQWSFKRPPDATLSAFLRRLNQEIAAGGLILIPAFVKFIQKQLRERFIAETPFHHKDDAHDALAAKVFAKDDSEIIHTQALQTFQFVAQRLDVALAMFKSANGEAQFPAGFRRERADKIRRFRQDLN
jgi:hypothetical protein